VQDSWSIVEGRTNTLGTQRIV